MLQFGKPKTQPQNELWGQNRKKKCLYTIYCSVSPCMHALAQFIQNRKINVCKSRVKFCLYTSITNRNFLTYNIGIFFLAIIWSLFSNFKALGICRCPSCWGTFIVSRFFNKELVRAAINFSKRNIWPWPILVFFVVVDVVVVVFVFTDWLMNFCFPKISRHDNIVNCRDMV